MFDWFRNQRRKYVVAQPFDPSWRDHIARNVAHWRWLDAEERHELEHLTQVFVAQKRWEGCGGLALDDEMRVTIAAQACLLVLALPHDMYRNVESILVYPSAVVPPRRHMGIFTRGPLLPSSPEPRLGEAHLRGPVILAWDAVKRTSRSEAGHNLVFHEFAHKLDMLSGAADGTPPLPARADYPRWAAVLEREFLALRAGVSRGEPNLLDGYGATDEAEFFAVVTETFFEQPVPMRAQHMDLYAVLTDFYRQDPAARHDRAANSMLPGSSSLD